MQICVFFHKQSLVHILYNSHLWPEADCTSIHQMDLAVLLPCRPSHSHGINTWICAFAVGRWMHLSETKTINKNNKHLKQKNQPLGTQMRVKEKARSQGFEPCKYWHMTPQYAAATTFSFSHPVLHAKRKDKQLQHCFCVRMFFRKGIQWAYNVFKVFRKCYNVTTWQHNVENQSEK